MLKHFKLLAGSSARKLGVRFFLPDTLKCSESWNSRLKTPVLQPIQPETFYYELDQKFQQHGKCSAIDIDIFLNKLTDDSYTDEAADLLHKLRMTAESTNILESTSHALVRNYLEHSRYNELIGILNDRLSYGIFLDSHTATLAMDTFLQANNFTSAAKIASLLMLQEDFGSSITKVLALYSCIKYLQNPHPFEEIPETLEISSLKPKKKDEIKTRVHFIRNEYFDNHFDLKDGNILVGKSLSLIGSSLKGSVGINTELLGYFYSNKYSEVTKIMEENETCIFYKDNINNILKQGEKIQSTDVHYKKCIDILKDISTKSLLTDSFDETVKTLVNKTIMENEVQTVNEQNKVCIWRLNFPFHFEFNINNLQIYSKWCEIRQDKLDQEINRLKRARRLLDVQRITNEMTAEEQKLWFFEYEDSVDLQIDSKKVFYPKRWFGKKKKPRVIDEGYIPPEITRNK